MSDQLSVPFQDYLPFNRWPTYSKKSKYLANYCAAASYILILLKEQNHLCILYPLRIYKNIMDSVKKRGVAFKKVFDFDKARADEDLGSFGLSKPVESEKPVPSWSLWSKILLATLFLVRR